MANFIPGWNFRPASETNPLKTKLSITWRGIQPGLKILARYAQTGLGFSARPNGLKNPCNRYHFFSPGWKRYASMRIDCVFRTSVNFLMEICVLRPGWNWACNRNNISARAEIRHVIHDFCSLLLHPRGGYSQKNWVGVCGPLPKTLTLFMTKICDFPYPWPDQKIWYTIYELTLKSTTCFGPALKLFP